MIEEVYRRLEGEVGSEGKRRVEGESEARRVVREVIGKTIERPIDGLGDDTDLFDFGVDSLQSTRIRNAIQRVRAFVSPKFSFCVIRDLCEEFFFFFRILIWVERSYLSMQSLNILLSPSA